MSVREALSILPEYTEDEDGSNYVEYPRRWWHWRKEWGAERFQLIVGDVQADNEHEGGEPSGFRFCLDVELFSNTGYFNGWFPDTHRKFEDHVLLSLCFIRWGISLMVRGREIHA